MIDVEKLRKSKGRRIYLFWLDEKTGDITDVTSRDDVVQVIRCKDCSYYGATEKGKCPLWCAFIYPEGYCFRAERKKDG